MTTINANLFPVAHAKGDLQESQGSGDSVSNKTNGPALATQESFVALLFQLFAPSGEIPQRETEISDPQSGPGQSDPGSQANSIPSVQAGTGNLPGADGSLINLLNIRSGTETGPERLTDFIGKISEREKIPHTGKGNNAESSAQPLSVREMNQEPAVVPAPSGGGTPASKPAENGFPLPEKTFQEPVSDKLIEQLAGALPHPNRPIQQNNRPVSQSDLSAPQTDRPVKPTDRAVTQTDRQVQPTDRQLLPTDRPVTQTDRPVTQTERPVTQTERLVQPTDRQVTQTDRLVTQTEREVPKPDRQVSQNNRQVPGGIRYPAGRIPVSTAQSKILAQSSKPNVAQRFTGPIDPRQEQSPVVGPTVMVDPGKNGNPVLLQDLKITTTRVDGDSPEEPAAEITVAGEQKEPGDRAEIRQPVDSRVEQNPISRERANDHTPKEHGQPQGKDNIGGTTSAPGGKAGAISYAESAVPRTPLRADVAAGVMNQIIKGCILRATEKGTEAKLVLRPESLGAVKLNISMEDGKMVAKIDVANTNVKTVVESNLQQLHEALSSSGVEVQRIDVSSADVGPDHRRGNGGAPGDETGGRRQEMNEDDEETKQTRMMGYNTIEMIV
jgi:flagellar hook-length control protein FliK